MDAYINEYVTEIDSRIAAMALRHAEHRARVDRSKAECWEIELKNAHGRYDFFCELDLDSDEHWERIEEIFGEILVAHRMAEVLRQASKMI